MQAMRIHWLSLVRTVDFVGEAAYSRIRRVRRGSDRERLHPVDDHLNP